MTGTPSRTATASPRGGVERKLKAKPRSEEHEPHMRQLHGGREGVGTQSPMSSGLAVVDVADARGEGHVSYPGRSVCLPCASPVERRGDGRAEISRGQVTAVHSGEGPNL